MDFSEFIAACDLKVGWCGQLIELMKVWIVKVISLPWPQDIYIWKLKLVFLRNHYILYVSLRRYKEIKSINLRMMLAMPIHGKNATKIFSRTGGPISMKLYVASGTTAHNSLFKLWPWVNLDLFYGKVKFWNLSFYLQKCVNSFAKHHIDILGPDIRWAFTGPLVLWFLQLVAIDPLHFKLMG